MRFATPQILRGAVSFRAHGAGWGLGHLSHMAHIQSGRSGEEELSPPPVQSATTRLRGLPYSATEEDLIAFFEDFEIVSTHICKRSGTRPCPGALFLHWRRPLL